MIPLLVCNPFNTVEVEGFVYYGSARKRIGRTSSEAANVNHQLLPRHLSRRALAPVHSHCLKKYGNHLDSEEERVSSGLANSCRKRIYMRMESDNMLCR